jgi:hypothetical protein
MKSLVVHSLLVMPLFGGCIPRGVLRDDKSRMPLEAAQRVAQGGSGPFGAAQATQGDSGQLGATQSDSGQHGAAQGESG